MIRGGAAFFLCALLATEAGASGVAVVAPHPDDELTAAGGVLYGARAAGRDVAVIVVTNGDYLGVDYGITREGESIAALAVLGIPEEQVVFLGYPDSGLLPLWNNAPVAGQVYLSPRTGRQATYGSRGRGHADFHTATTGAAGAYNLPTLAGDVRDAIALFRPDDVFTTGIFDDNPDHRATFYAVRDALQALAAADASYRPTLHTTVVHDPVHYPFDDFWPAAMPRETPLVAGNDEVWPNPSATSGVPNRFAPTQPYAMPPSLALTVLDWGTRVELPVPPPMAVADFGANLKAQSLVRYGTQLTNVLWAHVKADEFFWAEPIRPPAFSHDIARAAVATATSASVGQGPAGAIDGIVDGVPGNAGAEWATAAPGVGAALHLAWRSSVIVDRVTFFDRVSLADRVTAGRLVLDDGYEFRIPPLANDGRGDDVVLPEVHRINSLTFLIEGAAGTPGLAELAVFGVQSPVPCTDDVPCDDGNPCTVDVCRAGFCDHDPVADGTACGDGDACDGVEMCAAGECTRQPPPDCDDGDPCTRDTCSAPGTCNHEPVCRPQPAHGRGRCRVAIVGLPATTCQDGDPACDRDGTADGGCRFHVILCINSGPAAPGCAMRAPLAQIRLRGSDDSGLGDLVARLGPRLPATAPTCVGPAAIRVPALAHHRVVRRRVPLELVTGDGRRLGARLLLACKAAPPGVVARPPASPGP